MKVTLLNKANIQEGTLTNPKMELITRTENRPRGTGDKKLVKLTQDAYKALKEIREKYEEYEKGVQVGSVSRIADKNRIVCC